MSFDAPKVVSPEEWLSAFIPLGSVANESWTPVGAGVLILDNPIVWLVTAKRLLETRGSSTIAGWVGTETGGTLLDLTTGRAGTDLDWISDPEHDLAACLFPLNPAFKIKAFTEARCLPAAELQPLLPVATLSGLYGATQRSERPQPLTLPGHLSLVEENQLLVTAPILPNNGGAPLLVPLPAQAGGGVVLAGICTNTIAVPEAHGSLAPPVRLTRAIPIARALELIRSDAGKAQRKAALAKA